MPEYVNKERQRALERVMADVQEAPDAVAEARRLLLHEAAADVDPYIEELVDAYAAAVRGSEPHRLTILLIDDMEVLAAGGMVEHGPNRVHADANSREVVRRGFAAVRGEAEARIADLEAENARLRVLAAGAARLAAFDEDRLFPNDPNPQAQTDLRAMADAVDAGEPFTIPDGAAHVFAKLRVERALLAAPDEAAPEEVK